MDNQPSDEQIQAKQDLLNQAATLEELTRHPGWNLVTGYIQNQIKAYTNKALIERFKTMDEYQYQTGVVNGLRGLLGHIEEMHRQLVEERKGSGEQAA